MSFHIPPSAMARLMRASRDDWLDPGNMALTLGLLAAIFGPYLLAGSETAFDLHVLGRQVPTLDAAFQTISGAHGPQLGIDAIGGIVVAAAITMPATAAGMLLHYIRPAARRKLREAMRTSLAARLRNAVIGLTASSVVLWLLPLVLAAFGGGRDVPKLILATLLSVILASMVLSGVATRLIIDIAVAPRVRQSED